MLSTMRRRSKRKPFIKKTKGVLIIPSQSQKRPRPERANVKVIQSLDIKGTRLTILGNWRSYTPKQIVSIFRKHYTNMRSLSVMLSRFKKELSQLEDAPNDTYLQKIALKKSEYNEIRKTASETRRRGALAVQIISNADAIVLQAMQYIVSSDPNLLN